METSSLSPSPTIIVPDDHPFDVATGVLPQAAAQGTVQPHGTGSGSGEQGRLPPSPPTFGTRPRRRWQRCLAWSGLGLLVSFVWVALWLWRQPPFVPPSPSVHNDHATSALPGATAPVALPTATRPPTQSQGPVDHMSIVGTTPGSVTPDRAPRRPKRSQAREAAPRRSKDVAPPRAARTGHRQHVRRPQTTTRSRKMEYKPVGGVYHRGEPFAPWPSSQRAAPNPAPEVKQPWNWHVIPTTGDG
jgi:hypothetical protein